MTNRSIHTGPTKVGLISLGCAKNLVDAEIMLGSLLRDGYEVTNDATQADVVIVNTCSFIDAAQEESVDTILESAQVREARKRGQGIVVSGCLPQRFRTELPQLLPEVDAFMGVDQVAQVGQVVAQALARRGERLAAEPAARKPDKARLMASLSVLDQAKPDPEAAQKPAGAGPKGPTKTVVGKPAAGELVRVNPRPTFIPDFATPRFRLTPRHMAYVKIAEGCNHPCSFCIIPRMRGSHRSRAMDDIVQEARALLADGVRELNLISQDATYYGLDLRPNHSRAIASPERFRAASQSLPTDAPTLAALLRRLDALPGNFWVRLLYTHPAHWTEELIQTIAECRKVARYIDIPLQHIHDDMLQKMRRETSRAYVEDLLRRLRAGIPGVALRTTFIVGFPGETPAHFASLAEFIERTRFERLGVFKYSREDGTVAAGMSRHVGERIKEARRQQVMALQRGVSREWAAAQVGKTLKVLVERPASNRDLAQAQVSSWEHGLVRGEGGKAPALKGRYAVARGEADAPDIDGRVYVRGASTSGRFAKVRIVGHTDYDLIAEPA